MTANISAISRWKWLYNHKCPSVYPSILHFSTLYFSFNPNQLSVLFVSEEYKHFETNLFWQFYVNQYPYKLKMIFYMTELYYEILSNNNLRLITRTVVWLLLTESILPMICSLRLTHLMIWMMTRMVVIRWIIRRLLCSYVSHYCYQFDGLISSLEMSFFECK